MKILLILLAVLAISFASQESQSDESSSREYDQSEEEKSILVRIIEELIDNANLQNIFITPLQADSSESSESSESDQSDVSEENNIPEELIDVPEEVAAAASTLNLENKTPEETRKRIEELLTKISERRQNWKELSEERREMWKKQMRERIDKFWSSSRRGERDLSHRGHHGHHGHHHHHHHHEHEHERDPKEMEKIRATVEEAIEYIRERVKEGTPSFPQDEDKEKLKAIFKTLPETVQKRMHKKFEGMRKKFERMPKERREEIIKEMHEHFMAMPDKETREKNFVETKKTFKSLGEFVDGRLKEKNSKFPEDSDFKKMNEIAEGFPEKMKVRFTSKLDRLQEKLDDMSEEDSERLRSKLRRHISRRFGKYNRHHPRPHHTDAELDEAVIESIEAADEA